MSLHFEWTLSLRLRPDVPAQFVDELRYHLGLSGREPEAPTLVCSGPALVTAGDGDELAGGPVARLVRQQPGSGPATWGVFARVFVLDDAMYELVQIVPPWLARWSLTEGWIGFAREELNLNFWLSFYAAGGHAYAAAPGEGPQALSADAPPFTAGQATEPWMPGPARRPTT
jgi:hypothetical protein